MSCGPGVPGIAGRPSPGERPERPLVVPSRLWLSGMSGRLRFGRCFAAEERRRRWPEDAEKEDWEASVTCVRRRNRSESKNAAGVRLSARGPKLGGSTADVGVRLLSGRGIGEATQPRPMRTTGGRWLTWKMSCGGRTETGKGGRTAMRCNQRQKKEAVRFQTNGSRVIWSRSSSIVRPKRSDHG